MNMNNIKNIAVVGAGVAGLVASFLLQKKFSVTLFEKNNDLGGHTNTIEIKDGPDAGTPVDTGFIVLNQRTYPAFHRFLNQLGVPVRTSDMSFSMSCQKTGLQYAGTGLNGLFAQRVNFFNPGFYSMLVAMARFGRVAYNDLNADFIQNMSLIDYFLYRKFPQSVIDNYFIPMGAAIWSTPARKMLDFPAITFLRFFNNHGLLRLHDMPVWQTVQGGSYQYVKAFIKQFNGTIHTSANIHSISRDDKGVTIAFENGNCQTFDKVIIATHADQALKLLADPTPNEQKWLGAWSYTHNDTVLHTDRSVMPTSKRAWASWNYVRENTPDGDHNLSVTYDMNRLQGLNTKNHYFVTLNRYQDIDPDKIIKRFDYTHPQFDFAALESQENIRAMNGVRKTYFCGSYCYYGFHEDAVKSAIDVADHFGVAL